MQSRPKNSAGNQLLQKAANLPNETTPNYEVATAATVLFGVDTLLSWANCGSTSFYFNALLTLVSGGIAYNQYNDGTPLKKAKAMYAGMFGKAPAAAASVTAEPEVKAPALN